MRKAEVRSQQSGVRIRRTLCKILLNSVFCLLTPFASVSLACGTAPTKLFFSTAAGSLTGTHTLVTASGTEATDAGPKTAKTTATWFQLEAGVTANTTSTNDSSTADSKGWINDSASVGAGCSIPAGTWTFSDSMSDTSGTQASARISVHVYKANAGVFTAQACGFTNTAVSMSTTAATITASATCSKIDIHSGDKIYVELYYETGTSNSSSSTTAQTTERSLGTNDFVSFPQDIATPAPKGGRRRIYHL